MDETKLVPSLRRASEASNRTYHLCTVLLTANQAGRSINKLIILQLYHCVAIEIEIAMKVDIVNFFYFNAYVPECQSCQDDYTHNARRIQLRQTGCIPFRWRSYGHLCLSLKKRWWDLWWFAAATSNDSSAPQRPRCMLSAFLKYTQTNVNCWLHNSEAISVTQGVREKGYKYNFICTTFV